MFCRRRWGGRSSAGRSAHGVGCRRDCHGCRGRRRWGGHSTDRNRRRGAWGAGGRSMHERPSGDDERECAHPDRDREDDGPPWLESPTTASRIRPLLCGGRRCVEDVAAVRGRRIALEVHVRIRVREVGRPLRRRRGPLSHGWLDRPPLSDTPIPRTWLEGRHGLRRERPLEDLSRSHTDRPDGHRRNPWTVDPLRASHCSTGPGRVIRSETPAGARKGDKNIRNSIMRQR